MCGSNATAMAGAGLTAQLDVDHGVVDDPASNWAGARVQNVRFTAGCGRRAEDVPI